MSISITSPVNSFVQFPALVTMSCGDQIDMCLPVYLESDVRFQIFVNVKKDENVTLFARIVSACDEPLPVGYNAFYSGTFNEILLESSNHDGDTYVATLDYLGTEEFNQIQCGQCFYIQLVRRTVEVIGENDNEVYTIVGCSNCFTKICDPCYTSVITYRCNEDAFGFEYFHLAGGGGNALSRFYNVIRLPMYLCEPQLPTKDKAFVKSDGSRKILSSRVEKEYTAKTEWFPETWRENLVMAMKHDEIYIENTNAGISPAKQFTCEGQIKWEYAQRLDYPLAFSEFKVNLTPYLRYNSNCN